MELDKKVAVIVGGTSGIGAAIAKGYLRQGAKVVATSRDSAKVQAMAKEISEFHEALVRPVNVLDSKALTAFYLEVQSAFGAIDIVVNCAGTHLKKPTLEVTDDEWSQVLDTNLNGTFYSCRAAAKIMCVQKAGAIINIASLGSFVALGQASAYCASKAAVVALTKNLAIELADFGVRVNAIAPGVFETQLNAQALSEPARRQAILQRTPMGRFGQLAELVSGAVYLASDNASFTTGVTLVIDGGFLAKGI